MRPPLPRPCSRRAQRGFTIVELAIAVIIVGILASMAMHAIARVRREARAVRFVNDLRVVRDSIETYAMEYGYYPEDGIAAIPEDFLSVQIMRKWKSDTPIGGVWDWDYEMFGVVAAMSVYQPDDDELLLRSIDRKIDDGNLTSGLFRRRDGGVMYVLQEEW